MRTSWLWIALLLSFTTMATMGAELAAATSNAPSPALQDAFRDPPASARPWVYWWWVAANVDEQTITRDLEEMKKKGIGGVLMFDARGYHDNYVPPPPAGAEFMDAKWRQLLKFSVQEASRLGIQMSVNLSSCAGALKGPWEVGDDAPKKLCWKAVEVQGPQRLSMALPQDEWGRFWDAALVAARHAEPTQPAAKPGEVLAAEVVDLAGHVDAQGRLAWDVPAGKWTLIRFVCALMEDRQYDVDILSESAVEGHFNRMAKAVLADAGPLAGKAITHFYSVSWEGAIPTWTPGFDRYFLKYCGYDVRPYLPVLAGITVRDRETSDRFQRDYNRALAECFQKHFYGRLRELCHRAGVQWHSESGGPWKRDMPTFKHADQLAFLAENDMPQGEFWWGRAGRYFNRPIAMAARTYGRPFAAAEAFTHMQLHWSAYPATIKPMGDVSFCDGINFFIWHTFTCSPPEFGKPGIEYFAGTHINPNVTWWEQSGAFLKYLARCQHLLRQGQSVVDVCCYTGDEPYLHWGRAEKWTAKPKFLLGKGYTYDLVNTPVLLERLQMADGRLVLPDGMQYRLLVVDLDGKAVPPAALRKIVELVQNGATVVLGDRPEVAPGLRDYPACDQEVVRLAEQLWGPPATGTTARKLGKGQVIVGRPIDEVLQSANILPDFDGPLDWTHRRDGDTDIYFLASIKAQQAECTFRVAGKEPEFWDAVTGQTRDAVCCRTTDDGRTVLPVSLPENGSLFVVFRKPAAAMRIASVAAAPGAVDVLGREGDKARLTLWTKDRCTWSLVGGGQRAAQCAELPEPLTLSGSWEVRFTPGWGAPASAVFEKLLPWNEHPDAGIKHFSGTGTYHKKFTLSAQQAAARVRLQLGEVNYLAEVRVNGKDLGLVWTAPWCLDLTGAVRAGENHLEIAVTNVWANRLIGDAALPPEKRLTKTNVQLHARPRDFKRHEGYSAHDPLLPAGLVGPVCLQFGRDVVQ